MELACDRRGSDWRLVAAYTNQIAASDTFDAALASVSDHRREKALSFRFAKDRQASLLAGLLLDELLREHGLRERNMVYELGTHGKPAFASRKDLHFSLSHSAGMAVAALCESPIGVDVEHLPSFPRTVAEPLAWTEMESVGKLLGCGVGTFVDAGVYERPGGVTVEHLRLGDHLVCTARKSGLPWNG